MTFLSQAIDSSSGPSACRQALVTSSETTSRTSSAAARWSAPAAGSQPQAYSAWRVKSRASGTTPLSPSKFSLRTWRPPDDVGTAVDGLASEKDAPAAGTSLSDAPVHGIPPSDAPEAPLGSGPRSPGE